MHSVAGLKLITLFWLGKPRKPKTRRGKSESQFSIAILEYTLDMFKALSKEHDKTYFFAHEKLQPKYQPKYNMFPLQFWIGLPGIYSDHNIKALFQTAKLFLKPCTEPANGMLVLVIMQHLPATKKGMLDLLLNTLICANAPSPRPPVKTKRTKP